MHSFEALSSTVRTLVLAAIAGGAFSLVSAIERLASVKPAVEAIYRGRAPSAFTLIASWHLALSCAISLVAIVLIGAIIRMKESEEVLSVGAWFAVLAFILAPIVSHIASAPMAEVIRMLSS